MANSLKRPLRRDTASAYGAWGGISNYVDAACAAVHSIAVRPVSWDTGRRHIAKNVPWMVTATSCDPCRSYRAASSYSSLRRIILAIPVTWPLPSSLSPLFCLAACEFLCAEGSPQPWLPVTRFSVRKAVLVLLSPSLPNSLHSSRLTIAPRFQNADLGDDVRRSVAVPPNSWPTSVRAARQENAVCPALSPPAVGSSVRKAFLGAPGGTWVHLAPSKAY